MTKANVQKLEKYLDIVNNKYSAGMTITFDKSPFPIPLEQQFETQLYQQYEEFDTSLDHQFEKPALSTKEDGYSITLHPKQSQGLEWLEDVLAPLDYLPVEEEKVQKEHVQLVELKDNGNSEPDLEINISLKGSKTALPHISKVKIANVTLTQIDIEITTAIGQAHMVFMFLEERPGIYALSAFIDTKFTPTSLKKFLQHVMEGHLGARITTAIVEDTAGAWEIYHQLDATLQYKQMPTEDGLVFFAPASSSLNVSYDAMKASAVTIEFKDWGGYIINIPLKNKTVNLQLVTSF